MDFTRKYGTRFWTLLDEMAEAAELANELTEYETTIEYPSNIGRIDSIGGRCLHRSRRRRGANEVLYNLFAVEYDR